VGQLPLRGQAVSILALRPNLTREEAMVRLRAGALRRLAGGGPLRSVADVYVPFHLFRVRVHGLARPFSSCFAVDAVTGSLDPYQFEEPPREMDLVRVETRNRPEPVLAEDEVARRLRDKVRRLVFQTGFFRVRGLEIELTRTGPDLHVPYWLGFYGTGQAARLRVLDGVRRRVEGGKARALFEGWLAT
jgi:hypothetical protein